MTAENFLKKEFEEGNCEDITCNPDKNYNLPFYQSIIRVMEKYRNHKILNPKSFSMENFNETCKSIEEEEFNNNLDTSLENVKAGAISENDIAVLNESIEKLRKRIKKLQYYKTTSLGLYCIDKNPEEVNIEWIRENVFQLK